MSLRLVRKDNTMITKARSLLLAATLMAAPIAAMAQPTPAVNNPSASGTSTTAQPSYGANPSSPNMNSSSAATDPNVPGATGQTVVKGSTSSMAGSNRVNPDPNAAATSVTGK
jgi:hypothetical protein